MLLLLRATASQHAQYRDEIATICLSIQACIDKLSPRLVPMLGGRRSIISLDRNILPATQPRRSHFND